MKKRLFLLLAFITFVSGFAQNDKTAAGFLNDLFSKKYSAAHAYFADEVKGQIPEQALDMVVQQIAAGKGNYKNSSYVKTEKQEGFERVTMKSSFEKGSQNLFVVFNENGKIVGFFKAPGENVTMRPQNPKAPFPYAEAEVKVVNTAENVTLAGTLVTPEKYSIDAPAVIFISGSGAQNRDSELMGHKPFLVMSDYLARQGIASLRLDDRGTGQSQKGKEGVTSENFAADISSAVQFLKTQGFNNIGLIGHSEGGMIAPMVAQKNKDVKFLVLLAAPGVTGKELMLKQAYEIGRVSGLNEAQLQEAAKINDRIYSYVVNYQGKDLRTDVTILLTDNLTQIPEDQRAQAAATQGEMLGSPWFSYFLKFDPYQNLSKTKIPVLALNGIKDLQVDAAQNLAAIRKALQKAGNKNFETVEMPGLNHLFQTATTGNPTEYEQIEETVSPKVLDKISAWILNRKK